MITREWLETEIKNMTLKLEEAKKQEDAAKEHLRKTKLEYMSAKREKMYLTALIRGLENELNVEQECVK